MANTFRIVISATDKASAIVRGVKAEIAGVTGPVGDLFAAFNRLGRETGINKVVGGLKRATGAALSFGRSVALLSAPLAALAGAGLVAGITSLATGWGRAAQEISNTSAVIGIGTTDLQRYRGAAQLAGLSTSDMDSSLQSLGDTMQGAMFGRNPQALTLMNAYGISIRRTKDGAIDTTSALTQLSKAIQTNMRSGGNVQSARLIAGAFGAEGLLPILLKGPDAIRAYVAEMDRLNATFGPQSIQQGVEYNRNLVSMGLAVDSLKYSIGNALIPVFAPLLSSMASWIAQNREVIAQRVGDTVKELATWLKNIDWDAAKKNAQQFFDIISGAYNLLKGVSSRSDRIGDAAQMLGNRLRGNGPLTNAQVASQFDAANNPQTAHVVQLFRQLGWGKNQAAALAANAFIESKYDPKTVGDNGTAVGAFQWHPDRQAVFKQLTGKDLASATLDDQIRFADYELRRGNEQKAGALLGGATDAYEAGDIVSRYFERPKSTESEAALRGRSALAIADPDMAARVNSGNVAGGWGIAQPLVDGINAAHDTGPAAAQTSGTVNVTIDHRNAPPGTRTSVSTSGDVKATARVGYAMDGAN